MPTALLPHQLVLLAGFSPLLALGAAPPPRTVRVGPSPDASARTIASGVALVPLGQIERWTVAVEPGTYRERVWVNASMGPLTLTGLGPPEDTLLVFHCAPRTFLPHPEQRLGFWG